MPTRVLHWRRIDMGNVVYAVNHMVDYRDRHILWGWLQVCLLLECSGALSSHTGYPFVASTTPAQLDAQTQFFFSNPQVSFSCTGPGLFCFLSFLSRSSRRARAEIMHLRGYHAA